MSKRFVILASQRTGSYMLMSALAAIDGVTCYGELFRKNDIGITEDSAILGELDPVFKNIAYRREHYADFLEAMYSRASDDLTGFKLMLRQNPAVQASLVNSSDYRKIIIDRPNVLAMYASHLAAKTTGIGFLRKGERREVAKVLFDEQDFNRFWRRYRKKYGELEEMIGHNNRAFCLSVEYLDLVNGKAFAQVLGFLGLSADPDITKYTGTQKRSNADIIQRFDDPDRVVDYLGKVDKLEWCVED